jgi:tRNA nucleotidyltransferase (CCA-adding enzyme)
MKAIEPDLDLRLTMLFHDIAKPFTYSKDEKGVAHYKDHAQKGAEMAREILNRLKFNKKTIQRVTKLIEYHDYEFTDNDVRIKQFLQKFGTDDVDALFAVKRANYYAKNPAYVSELTKIDEDYARVKAACRKTSFVKKNELKITGKDLLELGVPQENVGKVLDEIYELIINGKLKNNREKMIDYTINQILPKGYDDSEIVSLKKE